MKRNRIFRFLRANWPLILNAYVFLNFLGWTAYQAYMLWRKGRIDYVEISFFAQNIILTTLIAVRLPHRAINTNAAHQLIALAAFFSGALFMGTELTTGTWNRTVSVIIVSVSNVLGIITLINLGRSFGILIALRTVKTRGAYGLIRHPMYFTDILLRVGYLFSHASLYTVTVFILSTACYVYRALLEERFLSRDPEYRRYMQRVRYRFLPGVF